MAQRKTRFDNLMEEYGVKGGTEVFAAMQDFEAKKLVYDQLYKVVKKALGTGQKSIMGGIKKFNARFVESELVKNSGLKPEEVFAKIVAVSEKNWGSYPGTKDDTKTRKTYYDEFKGFAEEVTAEDIDEKFASLVTFATDVKNLVDVYRKINLTVVDNPTDAKNQLDKLVKLTGADTSQEIQQVVQLMDNYRYEDAIKMAKRSITALNRANAEREAEVEAASQSRTERFESAFLTYRRLGSIAHFVEEGHDKLGTYTKLATEVNNFVKASRVYEANIRTAYTNAVKDGNVNLFFENENIDMERVENLLVAIERAEQQLLAAGVSLDSIEYDKKGRVDAKALAGEMEKLTVRKAGANKPQTREDFIRSAVKSFEILKTITRDKESYHDGEDQLVRNFIAARDAIIADEGIYKLISDGKADEVSDKDIKRFYENMDRVSNQIMSGDNTAENQNKGRVEESVVMEQGTSTGASKPNADSTNGDSEVVGSFGFTEEDVAAWRGIGRGGRVINPANGKGPLTVTSKDFDPNKPVKIKAAQIYNNSGLAHALQVYGHLRDIITLLSSMKLPKGVKDFFEVYKNKLVENTNFYTNYLYAIKKGDFNLKPEQIAEIRSEMDSFVANMAQVEAEFKSRGLNISKMVNSQVDPKTRERVISFNPEEFDKLINSYTSNPAGSANVKEYPVPDIFEDGLGASSKKKDGAQNNTTTTPGQKVNGKGGQNVTTVVTENDGSENGLVGENKGKSTDTTEKSKGKGGSNNTTTGASNNTTTGSSNNTSNNDGGTGTNNGGQSSSENNGTSSTGSGNGVSSTGGNNGGSGNGSSNSSTTKTNGNSTGSEKKSGEKKEAEKNGTSSGGETKKKTEEKKPAETKKEEKSNSNELPKVKKDGFFKRFGKWIARRPVITATILFAIATPIVGAVASGAVPSLVLWGGVVGLGLGANLMKAIVKGVFPGYKRFILNYDIDKKRKKLESAQERSRQIMKDVDSVLAKRQKTREDIRKYASIEELAKPKKEKVPGYKEMESYEKDKKASKKVAKTERKKLVEQANSKYAEELKQYQLRKKASKVVSEVEGLASKKLTLKGAGFDVTGLDADQIREIVRLGVELNAQEKRANKQKKKIDKKMTKVLKTDARLGGEYTREDSELQRQIRESEAMPDERGRELAESVKQMKVPKIMNTRLGRKIDGAVHGGYGKRTEAVEEQVKKAEAEVVSMIDRFVNENNTQAALDYIADDMLANNGVANETYLERVRKQTGNAGVQYIKAKYMELKSGVAESTASSTIYSEIEGKGDKKQSDRAMAELYGKSFYNDGMDEDQLQDRIKNLPKGAQTIITETYKKEKDKNDRLM